MTHLSLRELKRLRQDRATLMAHLNAASWEDRYSLLKKIYPKNRPSLAELRQRPAVMNALIAEYILNKE